MKDISIYAPVKYLQAKYEQVDENIYKTYDDFMKADWYVTSLCFVQETEYGEGSSPKEISQYPLEDILDEFSVAINDFYKEENFKSDSICYLEFSGVHIKDIKSLLSIVGKHVYNKEDGEYVKLIIE